MRQCPYFNRGQCGIYCQHKDYLDNPLYRCTGIIDCELGGILSDQSEA